MSVTDKKERCKYHPPFFSAIRIANANITFITYYEKLYNIFLIECIFLLAIIFVLIIMSSFFAFNTIGFKHIFTLFFASN